MALSVKHWQVSQEYNGSNHNSIEFELDKEKIMVEEQYQYHKPDWNLFANELRNNNIKIPNEITERTLEKCLDDYYASINKAPEKACPKKKPRIKDKNNPWWSQYLQKFRKQINKLYRNRKKSTEQWDEYKKEEKKYRNLCNKAKKSGLVIHGRNTKHYREGVLQSVRHRGSKNSDISRLQKFRHCFYACLLYTSPSPRD